MKVFAPGKLVLTGAYAVLEGAPAIVVAVSRGAFADAARTAITATPEVRAALGDVPVPHFDASAMFIGARKLGLGASAAILVASLAAREAERGADLAAPAVRDALFARARAAHLEAQGGGSGVDVAASVHGGVLRYSLGASGPSSARASLPPGMHLSVFACPTSARTSELRAEIERFALAKPGLSRVCMHELGVVAERAASAASSGDRDAFVEAVRRTADALTRLGSAAGVGIVPPGFDALAELAAQEDAAFCVSGAGGGDVVAYVGRTNPSSAFLERARALGLFVLDLDIDEKGVRIAPQPSALVAAGLGVVP